MWAGTKAARLATKHTTSVGTTLTPTTEAKRNHHQTATMARPPNSSIRHEQTRHPRHAKQSVRDLDVIFL